MIFPSGKARALGLTSGGLDSILSALILSKQGIEVEWISFETPFFSAENARKAARENGIPIRVLRITETYLGMLRNPPCGYGKNMNPCMDCHTLMFRLAGEIKAAEGFDFMFSGEVLGQRPFSQNKTALRYVEKHSGYDGYIVRPLSARLLAETVPEREGLVQREQLEAISGRSRKSQIKLAAAFGISDFPAPAGGCLLTESVYSKRLRDLFDHQGAETCREADLELLKYGRHLRLDQTTKIVVGRTKADNDRIAGFADPGQDILLKMRKVPGPVVLIPGGGNADMLPLAVTICASYSKVPQLTPAEAVIQTPSEKRFLTVMGLPSGDFKKFMI